MLLLVLGNRFLALYVGWEASARLHYLMIASSGSTGRAAGDRGEEGVRGEPGRRSWPVGAVM